MVCIYTAIQLNYTNYVILLIPKKKYIASVV